MSQIQVKRWHGDNYKVVSYLGTEYLIDVSQNQQLKIENLNGKELKRIPVKENCAVKLYRVAETFYIVTKKYVTEIVGAQQVWIISEDSKVWMHKKGTLDTEKYIVAIKGEDESISLYEIIIELTYEINFIDKLPQDYFPPTEMYDEKEMPLGIKVNFNNTLDTFWAFVKNNHTTQNGAFRINIAKEKTIKLSKEELVGEVFNPNYILTKRGIMDYENYKIYPICVENEELLAELSKYMNVPCQKGYYLALPMNEKYISLTKDKIWNVEYGVIDGFVWDLETMKKLYPIQEKNSTSKLYVYDNGLPHIIVTEKDNGINQYYVYYWKEDILMVAVSYRMPFICTRQYDTIIIMRGEDGEDFILRLTPERELYDDITGYVVESGYFLINDKRDSAKCINYLEGSYHCNNSKLQIYTLRSIIDQSKRILFCHQAKISDNYYMAVYPYIFDEKFSLQLLEYGYIQLLDEQEKTVIYYDWKEMKFYHGEDEFLNALIGKARDLISL